VVHISLPSPTSQSLFGLSKDSRSQFSLHAALRVAARLLHKGQVSIRGAQI
jgi:hypothetical protein